VFRGSVCCGQEAEVLVGPAVGREIVGKLYGLLARVGAMRVTSGFRVVVGKGVVLDGGDGCSDVACDGPCDVCGEAGAGVCGPSMATLLFGRSLPDVRIVLCEGCRVRVWHRGLWWLTAFVVAVVLGVGGAWGVVVVWPWAPWSVGVVGGVVGVLVGFFVGLLVPGRTRLGGQGWHGKPARVVAIGENGWTVDVVSGALAARLRRRGLEVLACDVVEHDVVPSLVGGIVAVVLVVGVLWWSWHPEVRVVNVMDRPLEIVVGGRSVAVVPGVPGEVEGAGRMVRIPRGWWHLRAQGLDGAVVEDVRVLVGSGRAQLFVPGSAGHCFRVDRRAYGQARQPRPGSWELPQTDRFHTLHERIDGWFEPNPVVGSSVWLSGGVRRAVRHSRCR